MSEILRKSTVWLARLVFGLIVPACLLWYLFLSNYSLQRQASIENSFESLNLALDRLEKFHDDQVFFHAMLQRNFSKADRAADPDLAVVTTVAAFRRVFPDKVKFIVWNNKGVVNKKLTDEKRYQFILKTMFAVLHNLQQVYAAGIISEPVGLPQITDKMNLLRGYFGHFLFEQELFDPLKPDHLGKCLFVSEEPEKRLLWYYPGHNFSLACFIDSSLLGKNLGPRMLISRFNSSKDSSNSSQKLAILQTISYESFGLPHSLSDTTEIKLEARKFESYAVSSRESDNFLVNFRQVTPDLIVLSYQNKCSLINSEKMAATRLAQIFQCLLVLAFIGYCFSLRLQNFCLTVQQKFLLLFVFSSGLPILVLISTGYEFFNEKKKDLVNSAHQESLRILREFDVRFPEVAASLAAKFNVFIDEKNAQSGDDRWPESDITTLRKMIERINPQEAMLFELDGNTAFYLADSSNRAIKLMTDMMQSALNFFIRTGDAPQKKQRNSILQKVSSNDLILHFFLSNMDRFSVLSSGSSERLAYIKFTGNRSSGKIWGLLAISWERDRFMREFIPARLAETADELSPRLLAVMDKKTEQIFSATPVKSSQIKRLMRQTRSRKLITSENVEVNGQMYLFSSISGNELDQGVLVALYPQNIIEKSIFQLKLTILAGILLVILVLSHIVRIFSRRLLLPVEGLALGISHLRQQDFAYSVDFQSDDELGQLIKVFNHTMKGMRELAIGTAVQVSLLPPENYRRQRAVLFARSIFMSKMGGDYYDYFDLPKNRLGLFFGDVAGHGIPAAMIMAMTKAVITAAAQRFVSPADVLSKANLVLQQLKKRNWRRMMTAQCVEFNCETGEFIIASAGHCYPVIVDRGGKTATLLEIQGFPLGSAAKKRYEEVPGRLQAGDTMVLYTDGIIEATNRDGEMFGYPRFIELLQAAWAEDLEVYWQQIFAGYNAWAAVQDDDLTFLLLRLTEKTHDK
ncbi:MAG: SpoIIE family protein phosphatase [Candidatus Riflebacteria bacterium]|nr:SpoIIE family protein phosphatase [Candidatus Riflebacteria bacterium]